jgi:hypothetical protein
MRSRSANNTIEVPAEVFASGFIKGFCEALDFLQSEVNIHKPPRDSTGHNR